MVNQTPPASHTGMWLSHGVAFSTQGHQTRLGTFSPCQEMPEIHAWEKDSLLQGMKQEEKKVGFL